MTFDEVLINDRYPLRLPPDRVAFHSIRPMWERGRLDSCAKLMVPGMVVYDIGAECGDFTALYRSWVGPDGAVVWVEPSPPYFPSIRQTWEANDFGAPPRAWFPGFAAHFSTVHAFAGPLARELDWPDGDWPTGSDGVIQPDFGFRHLAQQAQDTPSVKLDDLAQMTKAFPDAIVIDVEGAEFEVLTGATQLLLNKRPLVWVSVHEDTMGNWYHRTLDDLHAKAVQVGYRITDLDWYGEGETFELWEPK